jgi:RpiR family carbohydrate utilization transcriptional regulator
VTGLLEALRQATPPLRRAEARVAAAVLGDPEAALPLNLTALARRADVSEATVVRFCRAVGCDGFADFKIRLAGSLARGMPLVSAHVDPRDTAATYARKIFASTAAALAAAGERLDPAAVERAVDILDGARQIVCCGMGGSGAVAMDAHHKFLRLDVPANACCDPVIGRMLAAGMRGEDALLAISNTGRTMAVLGIVDLARAAGARTIAVTAPNSPLALRADVTIGIEPLEDVELYTPMASRLAHLTAIDVLSTGVLLRRGPAFQTHLARIKAGLGETRVPVEE